MEFGKLEPCFDSIKGPWINAAKSSMVEERKSNYFCVEFSSFRISKSCMGIKKVGF